MKRRRKTLFERAVESQGYCCPYSFFLEYENVDATLVAEMLDVAESTVYYNKRAFRTHRSQLALQTVPGVRCKACGSVSPAVSPRLGSLNPSLSGE